MNSKIFLFVILVSLFKTLDTNAQKIFTFNTMKSAFITLKCEGSIIIEESTLTIKSKFKGSKIISEELFDIISQKTDSDSLEYQIRNHKKSHMYYQLNVDFLKNIITLQANNRKKSVTYFYTIL